jgi:hypothetical protein
LRYESCNIHHHPPGYAFHLKAKGYCIADDA